MKLGARNITDLRNGSRLTPNDSNNRRHNEFSDPRRQQTQQQHSRSLGNLGMTTLACPTNQNTNVNWDQNQSMISCNGASATQNNFIVSLSFKHNLISFKRKVI